MEKRLTLRYNSGDDGNPEIEITVSRANVKRGAMRYRLMMEAEKENQAQKAEPELAALRLFTFPSIVCGTEEVKGMKWPMTIEEFLELDEALVDDWIDAINKVNPHWYSKAEDAAKSADDKKK